MTTFQFRPKWKEELVVTAKEGSFILDLTMGILRAYLPAEENWPEIAPAWAKDLYPALREELEVWCKANNAEFVIDAAAGVYDIQGEEIMALTEQHLTTVRTDFSKEDIPWVMAELERITTAETMDSKHNRNNAIGAILSLSKGDFEELKNLVTAAKTDFRDVIYWWYLENKKATHPE